MTPITGRRSSLETTPPQNVLDAESDERRMLAIVVERIAAGNAFDHEPGALVEAGSDVRLLAAINSAVGLG